MAEFLSTRRISSELEIIIKNAKKELSIVTPYLRFSTLVYELLRSVSPEVEMRFIYGKTELNAKEEVLLRELNCHILYKENLHAKCYMNESSAIVCSMNLHSFSEANNYEMGVLLSDRTDRKAFQDCKKELNLIISNARQIRMMAVPPSIKPIKIETGFCLRCKNTIQYSKSRPLCGGCFASWIYFENYDFTEKWCHRCGKQTSSSMRHPECKDCISK